MRLRGSTKDTGQSEEVIGMKYPLSGLRDSVITTIIPWISERNYVITTQSLLRYKKSGIVQFVTMIVSSSPITKFDGHWRFSPSCYCGRVWRATRSDDGTDDGYSIKRRLRYMYIHISTLGLRRDEGWLLVTQSTRRTCIRLFFVLLWNVLQKISS